MYWSRAYKRLDRAKVYKQVDILVFVLPEL